MKKILITSFHPLISRNILSSGVLNELRERKDIEIILLVPDYKVEYFTKMYGGKSVCVAGAPLYQASKTLRGLFFKKLGIFLFNTKSARQRKQYDFYLNRNLFRYVVSMALGYIGELRIVRNIVRFADLYISPGGFYTKILELHKPTLIFTTDVQNENDVSLMQDARKLGIPIISMVRSWDNLTLRFIRLFPDKLFVGSSELLEEAKTLHSYPEKDIVVVGNPHYNSYLFGATKTRREFFESFGLPLNKKLILYAPVSDALIRNNDIDSYVLSILSTVDASVLVRFPPEKSVNLGDFKKAPNMVYHRTGYSFKTGNSGDREMRPEDDESLINSLTYADLVITGPTSICIDAALKDKPAIAVHFYPTQRHFFETVWRYKDNHIVKMIKTGGVHLSTTKDDFLSAMYAYLDNPSKDKEGREIIRSKWFSKVVKVKGERSLLAKKLIDFVDIAAKGKL